MTEQERETHSPKQQTTNARNKTAPLATSAFTTEQSTVESPRARQGSSVTTHMSKGNHKTPVIIPAETTDYPLRIVNVVTGATGVASATIHQSTRGLSTPHSQGMLSNLSR